MYTQKGNEGEIALWTSPDREPDIWIPVNLPMGDLAITLPWVDSSQYDGILDELIMNDGIVEGVFRELPESFVPPVPIKAQLAQLGPLPPFSVFIGKCSDGLPFLMVLTEPEPGSILITGADHSGKTSLLKSMLISASELNSPDQVSTRLIASRPAEYERIVHYPHCQACVTPYGREASELIIKLSTIVDGRRSGRFHGSAMILAIDDLAALLRGGVDFETMSHLAWLIKHGPQYQVWTFAAMNTSQVGSLDPQLMDVFGTRLVGKTNPTRLSNLFPGIPYPREDHSSLSYQFEARLAHECIHFSAPSV